MALTLSDFVENVFYVKYGRVYPALDCWGLVRLARHELFGRMLLPAYQGQDPLDKQELTASMLEVQTIEGFSPCAAKDGAIATCWRASLCVHVGLVVSADGRLWVLETDEGKGASLVPLATVERRYSKVIYYDN